ncbi:MAG TPA: NUDIX hydrolase [Balneolales bacterium]|nr:NUDIX hydrolase [Balneolales bacterium]
MKNPGKLLERKLNSRPVFSGRLLHVYKDTVELPNGEKTTREYIKHPGATAVLPVYQNGDVMLIKQFRYPLSQIFYEVPAGKIDAGEDPETTGIRELKEETGLVCNHLTYIGHFYPSIGYTDEIIHLYIAWSIEEKENNTDDDEFLIPVRIPFKETIQMVHRGEISDGKSIICLLRAWDWWEKNNPTYSSK